MKKLISKQESLTNIDESKVTFEEDLKLCERLEETPQFQLDQRVETQEDFITDREEKINILTNDLARCIKTIESNNSKYIGEVNENNKKEGLGVCYYQNGDKYIGQFKDGKKEGIGKYVTSNGEIYQGEFNNNIQEGFLEHLNKNGTKQGYAKKFTFLSGFIQISNNNFCVEGDFETNNKNSGFGKIKKKRLSYIGEISNFESEGYGQSTIKDKYIYQGDHLNGKFNGYGEVFYPDNSKFFGFFNNFQRNGFSITFFKDGKVSFGKYTNDFKSGPFIVSGKAVQRVELWNNGFKSKLIEKFDLAKTYIKNFYPEFDWINKVNMKKISEIYAEISNTESKIPLPPPMKTVISNKDAENNTKQKINNEIKKVVKEMRKVEEVKNLIESSNVD